MIEQNIPLPPRKGRAPSFPAMEMKVGDSHFVAIDSPKPSQTPTYLRMACNARRWTQRTDRRFAVRTVDGGMRIWRTE